MLAGLVPLDQLVALANAGTLTAFIAVCAAMMVLRRRDPGAKRTFRTPLPWIIGPFGILGCLYLFYSLPTYTQQWFLIWNVVGLVLYFVYAAGAARKSRAASTAG